MFDKYFTRQLEIKLTASMLGISKKRWQCVKNESPNKESEAKQKMVSNSFDVLPIIKKINEEEVVESYFVTKQWNKFDEIEELKIKKADKINCKTSAKKLVKKFVENSRDFYFLEFKNEIVGLVSIVNLNAKEFRIYLYSLICELEILLRELISNYLNQNELLEIANNNGSKLYYNVLKTYKEDKENGVENEFIEYLYLTQFLNIISSRDLHKELGYKSKRNFKNSFSSLNEIRNPIAHPTRSLIKSPKEVKKLYERFEKLENAICILQKHTKTEKLAC